MSRASTPRGGGTSSLEPVIEQVVKMSNEEGTSNTSNFEVAEDEDGEEQVRVPTLAPIDEHNITKYNFEANGNRFLFSTRSCYYWGIDSKFRIAVVNIVTHKYFDRLMLLLIVLNSITLAMTDYSVVNENLAPSSSGYSPVTALPKTSTLNKFNELIEYFFSVMFCLECCLKVIAMGFFQGEGSYLRDNWNWLDFIVVISILLGAIPGVPGLGALRTIRVLRPLKTLNSLPRLKLLVQTLFSSISQLASVGAMMLFIFFFFGSFGVQLFSGRYHYRCRLIDYPIKMASSEVPQFMLFQSASLYLNAQYSINCLNYDQNCLPVMNSSIHISYYIEYVDNVLTNRTAYPFCVSPEDLNNSWEKPLDCIWPIDLNDQRSCSPPGDNGAYKCISGYSICGSNYDVNGWPRFTNYAFLISDVYYANTNWGIVNFDNFPTACLTIYQSITKQGWNQIMYNLQDSYNYVVASVYFVSLILFGSYIITNLLLAIIDEKHQQGKLKAEQMKSLHDATKEIDFLSKSKKKLEKKSEFLTIVQERNKNKVFKTFYFVVTSASFEFLILSCILINTVTLSLDSYPPDADRSTKLEIVNFILTMIFTIEAIMKLLGIGVTNYVRDNFNLFDILIVIISVLELMIVPPSFFSSGSNAVHNQSVTALRSLRLLRLLKLAKSWTSLQMLIATLGKSLADIGNFMVLLFLFLFIYSLIGVQLFANAYHFDVNGYPIPFDINHPENGYTTAFIPRSNFDSTYWSFLAVFQVLTGENWDDVYMNAYRATGWYSSLYFCSLFALGNYLILNLFTAIILGNFQANELEREAKIKSKMRKRQQKKIIDQKGVKVMDRLKVLNKKVEKIRAKRGNNGADGDRSKQSPKKRLSNPNVLLTTNEDGDSKTLLQVAEQKLVSSSGLKNNKIFPLASVDNSPMNTNANNSASSVITLHAAVHFENPASAVTKVKPRPFGKKMSIADVVLQATKEKKQKLEEAKEIEKSLIHLKEKVEDKVFDVEGPKKKAQVSLQVSALGKATALVKMGSAKMLKDLKKATTKASLALQGDEDEITRTGGGSRTNNLTKSGGESSADSGETGASITKVQVNHDFDGTLYGTSLWIFPPDSKIRLYIRDIISTRIFDNIILCFIILGSCSLAAENPLNDPNSIFSSFVFYFDLFIIAVFCVEFLAKVIVLGFLSRSKRSYIRSYWNLLDFFTLSISLLSLLFTNDSRFKSLRVLRSFRALRPLRVIKRNPGLKLVVNSLIAAGPDILNITLIVGFILFLFAIVGMNFFKGLFWRCDFTSLNIEQQHLVTYPVGFNDLNEYQRSYWPAIEGSNYTLVTSRAVCEWLGSTWTLLAVPESFDNVVTSMSVLVQLTTTEGWVDVMHAAVDGTQVDFQPIRDNQQLWGIYFVFYIFTGAFFSTTLFVGVIIENFNIMREILGENFLLSPQQKEWIKVQDSLISLSLKKKLKRPTFGRIRPYVFDIVHHRYFDAFIMLCILLNTIVLSMPYFGASLSYINALEILNYVFAFIFFSEATLKITALGLKMYFNDYWNMFDFTIVCGTNVGILLTLAFGISIGTITTVGRAFRILRVVRVVKRAESLRKLFNTLILALPQIANVGLLVLLVIFIYAIMGNQLFAKVELGQNLTVNANFQSFSSSILLLLRSATGEAWDWIMYDAGGTALNCVDDPPFNSTVCGFSSDSNCVPINGCGNYLAFIYFISFTILFSHVMLNLFIGVILEGFSDISGRDKLKLNGATLEILTNEWLKIDEEAHGVMTTDNLKLLFARIPPPLGYGNAKVKEVKIDQLISTLVLEIYKGTDNENVIYFTDFVLACAKRLVSGGVGMEILLDSAKSTKQLTTHKVSRATKVSIRHGILSPSARRIKHVNAALVLYDGYKNYKLKEFLTERSKMTSTKERKESEERIKKDK